MRAYRYQFITNLIFCRNRSIYHRECSFSFHPIGDTLRDIFTWYEIRGFIYTDMCAESKNQKSVIFQSNKIDQYCIQRCFIFSDLFTLLEFSFTCRTGCRGRQVPAHNWDQFRILDLSMCCPLVEGRWLAGDILLLHVSVNLLSNYPLISS